MSWSIPYTWKYLEASPEFAPWFICGEHADGSVDIVSRHKDLFMNVPRETAELIIALRDAFLSDMQLFLCE